MTQVGGGLCDFLLGTPELTIEAHALLLDS